MPDTDRKKKKRYKLKQLEIDRIDHVDRGANQHSDIVFYKRDDGVDTDTQRILEAVTDGLVESGVFVESAKVDDMVELLGPTHVAAIAKQVHSVDVDVEFGFTPVAKKEAGGLLESVESNDDRRQRIVAQLRKAAGQGQSTTALSVQTGLSQSS